MKGNKNDLLLAPPSWVTASTKRSWRSAVQRRRGLGSEVRTRQGSPRWAWLEPPCMSSWPSWGWINLENILFLWWNLKPHRREAKKKEKVKKIVLWEKEMMTHLAKERGSRKGNGENGDVKSTRLWGWGRELALSRFTGILSLSSLLFCISRSASLPSFFCGLFRLLLGLFIIIWG